MEWVEYSKAMFEKFQQAKKPFQVTYEITPFCNFRCNMCYVRLDPEQAKAQGKTLTTEQWLKIAAESRRMGATVLEVTGGEAVTRQDFPILYEAFIKMGFLIHLRTNGYLIKGEILELLKKYKPRRISITLYGASDETYQKICGISDGFSVVTQNILAMREAGLNVRVIMTVTNDNVQDHDLVKQWGKDHGINISAYGGLFTPVRAAKRSIEHLQVAIPDDEPDEADLAIQREIEDRASLMKPFWLCRGFGAKCCISWDGHMTICNTFTAIWSNPIRDGFEKAYQDLYEKLNQLRRPQECASCTYIDLCGACPSQIYSATGNPEQTCDKICRIARMRLKRYLRHMEKTRNRNNDEIITDRCEEGEE